MSKVLVFGGSGNVGRGVLAAASADPRVTSVVAIQRRPVDPALPRVEDRLVGDFGDLSQQRHDFKGADAVIFALGISQAAVSSEQEYRTITVDYALEAARRLADASPGATFVYVSGAGADPTMKSRILFARVKGEAENKLNALPGLRMVIARPGGVIPPRGQSSRWTAERIALPFVKLLERFSTANAIKSEALGVALLRAALDPSVPAFLDNRALRGLVAPGTSDGARSGPG